MDIAKTGDGDDSQHIAAKAAALLVVIGEPFSEEHKKLILGDITKGGSFLLAGVVSEKPLRKSSQYFQRLYVNYLLNMIFRRCHEQAYFLL